MRPMPELKITTAKVADLLPYVGNAKLHPHEQVDQIAKSMEEFGNCDPIAVWHNEDGDMEIVEGHGRLLALKKLGIKECPVITLDHLNDEQRRAYTHVHNQLTLNSDFDAETLADEISSIIDIDMTDFGFSVEEHVTGLEGEVEEIKPEYEIVKPLDYASNYVVLKFTTDIDWLWAQDVLGIEPVMLMSTRGDGNENGMMHPAIGRVLDGVETIRRLTGDGD